MIECSAGLQPGFSAPRLEYVPIPLAGHQQIFNIDQLLDVPSIDEAPSDLDNNEAANVCMSCLAEADNSIGPIAGVR